MDIPETENENDRFTYAAWDPSSRNGCLSDVRRNRFQEPVPEQRRGDRIRNTYGRDEQPSRGGESPE